MGRCRWSTPTTGIREGESGPATNSSRHLPAPRLSRMILLAALLCYVGVTMLNIVSSQVSGLHEIGALLCLVVIFVLQLVHSRPGANAAPARWKLLTLGTQAGLTYLPLLVFKAQWGSMAGFLAGSILLLLPPRPAWTLYGAVGLSMLAPPLLTERSTVDTFYFVQSTLLTGLVVYGLTRLVDVIHLLHETRGELTRVAVTKERLRFARDLHDLLGYSLSAITLKGELIHRLLPAHPARARTEVEDVLAISRQSLADVRGVASGYRDMSLRDEIDSAESVLNAADVTVGVRIRIGAVGQALDTVLATVLREAVTNVLRHSHASHCEITADHDGELVRLSVSNDGVLPDYRDPSPHSGKGLGNLEVRLNAVNGRLTVERRDDATFRLTASAPLLPAVDSVPKRESSPTAA
ncbi:sensor histidine kinase [Streptomyces sp. NBC_01506]|uniref:sensor histidine kinase n=1 Tax=Streptomyces sp. NBC_01506 TaxID=2903887 RepID=UPI00386CAB8D